MYVAPSDPALVLDVAPRLESWDSKASPAQIALQEYLDHVADTVVAHAKESSLSLALTVGLSPGVLATGGGRDLDNYLFPVARRLGMGRFDSAHAAKWRGPSVVAIGASRRSPPSSLDGWRFASATTTASATSKAWKVQVSEQVSAQILERPGDGPLAMHVGFRVSHQRAWANLWKPAIDALGAILGAENPERPFAPRDDRIVQLGLHRTVDPRMGHAVRLGAWWRDCERSSTVRSRGRWPGGPAQ